MKTHIGPSQILCSRIVRCLQGAAAVVSVAAVALATSSCGDDKKTTSSGTGGGGGTNTPVINTPSNANATTPAGDGTTSGNTTPAPTGTDIKVTLDGGAVTSPDGIHAVLSADASTVTVYPYDYCAWIASHDPSGLPYAGNGAGIIINIGPQGTAATPNTTYTVAPQTTANGITYDKNIIATYRDYPAGNPANECDITTRGALSGSASWTAVSSTSVSGTVDAKVIAYQPGSTSTVKGSFIATKCATTAAGATAYASDAAACHDAPDQGARPTSNGLHYK